MQVTDPVCGMRIDSERAVGRSDWRGTTYYFCGTGCQAAFERYPARFVEPGEGTDAPETGYAGGAKRRDG